MIEEYVSNIACTMGLKLSQTSIVDGQSLGCLDVYLVNISSKGRKVNILVYRDDIVKLENGMHSDRLETRIRGTLSRLQRLIDYSRPHIRTI